MRLSKPRQIARKHTAILFLPSSFLCYYTAPRRGLSARHSPPATMSSNSSLKYLILCETMSTTSRSSSSSSLSAVFFDSVTFCDDLRTTPPESFHCSTGHPHTGNDIAAHRAAGERTLSVITNLALEYVPTISQELEGQDGSHELAILWHWISKYQLVLASRNIVVIL